MGMSKDEYDAKRKAEKERIRLEIEQHNKRLITISKEYAESNDPYEIGDTINNGYQCGMICDKKIVCYSGELPQMMYICTRLTKAGNPAKRSPTCVIYQCSAKKGLL